MTKHNLINKGLSMNINTNQIQLSINKTQVMGIVADILASEDNAALLRAIQPQLADKFNQFPEFTNVAITSINEDGSASITLKQPRIATPAEEPQEDTEETEPIEPIEPIEEPVEAEPAPFED